MRSALAGVLFLAVAVTSAAGQSVQETPDEGSRRLVAAAVFGGMAGAGVGMAAGVLIGPGLEDCSGELSGASEMCGLGGALIGMGIGGVAGAASGAYIGARLRGGSPSVLKTAIAAVFGIGTGFLTAAAVERLGGADAPVFIGYAVGQGSLAGLGASLWR